MPREPRTDTVGGIFHLMNRGGAKRTTFESERDFRYVQSRMAYAVRRGEFEVLAFCLLMNHFHLLVRSRGGLSEAMRRIQNEYVRYFNRARGRDGPLFRGRFLSFTVPTPVYLYHVYRYIDENPVRAGLVTRPEDWLWGSAFRFACGRPSPWLSPWARDRLGVKYGASVQLDPAAVRDVRAGMVEARLSQGGTGPDALNDLLSGLPDRVRNWMLRKARLADGTAPGMPAADVARVLETIAGEPSLVGERALQLRGARRHPWVRLLTVGLLRDLAAATFAEAARRVGRTQTNVKGLYDLHRRAMLEDAEYASVACTLAEAVVGPLRPPAALLANQEILS